MFEGCSLLGPRSGLRAQPSQRFKIIAEGLYKFDRVIGPFASIIHLPSPRRSATHAASGSLAANGYDLTARYPKIVAVIEGLSVESCLTDGEAIVVDERGLSVCDALRCRLRDHAAVLCAFGLIALDGHDIRGAPLERRKWALAELLHGTSDGIAFNKHFDGDGAIIFRHVCELGCEGIVSKRLGSHYRSGRVDHWLKIKNPRL